MFLGKNNVGTNMENYYLRGYIRGIYMEQIFVPNYPTVSGRRLNPSTMLSLNV